MLLFSSTGYVVCYFEMIRWLKRLFNKNDVLFKMQLKNKSSISKFKLPLMYVDGFGGTDKLGVAFTVSTIYSINELFMEGEYMVSNRKLKECTTMNLVELVNIGEHEFATYELLGRRFDFCRYKLARYFKGIPTRIYVRKT